MYKRQLLEDDELEEELLELLEEEREDGALLEEVVVSGTKEPVSYTHLGQTELLLQLLLQVRG